MRPLPKEADRSQEAGVRRKLAVLFFLAASLLRAHAISMSNGEVTVRGDHLDFVLNMPMYEAAHAGAGT